MLARLGLVLHWTSFVIGSAVAASWILAAVQFSSADGHLTFNNSGGPIIVGLVMGAAMLLVGAALRYIFSAHFALFPWGGRKP